METRLSDQGYKPYKAGVAIENRADFVCAGMYDWQIAEDVNATIEILGSLGKRERSWYS